MDETTQARADYERGKAVGRAGGDWSDKLGESAEFKEGFRVGQAERKAAQRSNDKGN